MTLKLVAIGGLGNMLGPSATHLANSSAAHYMRVLDRGGQSEKKHLLRMAWQQHGATLVTTLTALLADGDFDGVVICAGKNGEDYQIISQVVPLLAAMTTSTGRHYFILHFSTVSCNFVNSTYDYCAKHQVHYANYPLTGGVKGAEAATMLILCSGDETFYTRLLPMLQKIGKPKYFGIKPDYAAAVKLIGHLMVFHGLLGISLAVSLHKQVFDFPEIDKQQTEFFDFLNQGAGGTHQWEFSVRPGVFEGQWERGFLLKHAVIDIIYMARLMVEQKLPRMLILPALEVALLFAYLLNRYPQQDLTTQAIARLIATTPRQEIDAYLQHYLSLDINVCIDNCITVLPEHIQNSLMLDVSYP